MPTVSHVGQEAATFAYCAFNSKIAHIDWRGGEAFAGFREIDSDPRYD